MTAENDNQNKQSEPVSPVAVAARKAYAQLRVAQSYRRQQNFAAATAEYEQIAANTDYLSHHRAEAREIIGEMERVAQGLPARDPNASRRQVPRITKFAAEIWVGPAGAATNPGTAAKPVATLAQARDAVRRLKARGLTGAVAVRIKPGEYHLTETFALTADDSGTVTAPVVYRAEQPGTARFRGGVKLHGFTPVTDSKILARLPAESRTKVWQCDLRKLDITEYGKLQPRGFGAGQQPTIPTLELYCNGEPMPLARWPNQGFVEDSKIFRAGSNLLSTFEYVGNRPAHWTQAEDLWLFGYWRESYADKAVRVGSIDATANRITTAEPYMDAEGIDLPAYPGIEVKHAIRYYAFNLLEEIDMPGEWYLERATGILYFYPPDDPAKVTVELSILAKPMVTLESVSHVRFEGLTFDLAQHDGIVIRGGENCLLAGCTISRLAGGGVNIAGGTGHGLLGCDLFRLGRNGTWVRGGDRPTLTPSGHFVENCHIHDFSRIDRSYTPAVWTDGVGTRIAHNLIHHTPCHALRLEGNEHVVEFNEIHSVDYESDDQGAIDMFGNPTYRGCVFRYNHFHHIASWQKKVATAGIRFDDTISGMLVYGNIFWRCSSGHFGAVQINSGRENIVENNVFADCLRDLSGGWTPGWSENNLFWKMFARHEEPAWTAYIMSDLYLSRYPLLTDLYDKPPINFVWRNVLWNCGQRYFMHASHVDTMAIAVHPDDNPGFVDPAHGDFGLPSDAPLVQAIGFRPIPVAEIGLYNDDHRATWPVASPPRAVPDWRGT